MPSELTKDLFSFDRGKSELGCCHKQETDIGAIWSAVPTTPCNLNRCEKEEYSTTLESITLTSSHCFKKR